MTKAELLKMVEKYNDNDELMFIEEYSDRDGFPAETTVEIDKIVRADAEYKRFEYGIYRYVDKEE